MPRTSTQNGRAAGKSAARAAPPRSTSKRSKTDVLSILQEDHKRVMKLFKQFEKVDREDSEAMQEIVEQACGELEVHAALEEEIFYPAMREALDEEDQEIMEEARVEHDTAKQLIAQLRSLHPGDATYAATFTVLGEYVKHHVQEEENEMFKQAKRAKLDLQALGEQIQERRARLRDDSDRAMEARSSGDGEAGPREIAVKEMDVEDEEDMEPAQPRAERRPRGAR